MKLYEITDAILAALAESDDGELSPGAEDRLDDLQISLEAKADNVARFIQHQEADAARFKAEADRLAALANSAAAKARRLKDYLRNCLNVVGVKRLDTELFKLTVCRNGVPSVSLNGITPEELPSAYQRVKVEADSRKITEDWKAGVTLPDGVTCETGTHLRLR